MEKVTVESLKQQILMFGTNKENARYDIKNLCLLVNVLESKISELAVQYDVSASIDGTYGAGRWVILDDDLYYGGYNRGDWIASSAAGC